MHQTAPAVKEHKMLLYILHIYKVLRIYSEQWQQVLAVSHLLAPQDIAHFQSCEFYREQPLLTPPECPSVHPYVCLSHRSTAAAACNRFAAERLAGRRYRSIAAGALRAPCSRRRRSAANAGSVTLTVDVGGWTQTCCISCGTVL